MACTGLFNIRFRVSLCVLMPSVTEPLRARLNTAESQLEQAKRALATGSEDHKQLQVIIIFRCKFDLDHWLE